MELELSVAWAMGLGLAVTRAAAFVALCPLIPRSLPQPVRASMALGLGLFIATPVPVAVDLQASDLLTNAFVNVTIGGVLGWFLGVPINMFQVAGSIIDNSSGNTLGTVFDRESGTTPGPITMAYTLTAQVLVFAMGGLTIITQLLWASTKVVALDGRLGAMDGLGAVAVEQLSELFRNGFELALPIVAVLFVGELAFGMLGRMVPQLNMFLVGLPLKSLLTLSMLGTASLLFPRFVDRMLSSGTSTALRLLGG